MKNRFRLFLLPLLVAGCTSISNLTPSQYPRSSEGYYRVEAAWHTSNDAVRSNSFRPFVQVGQNSYEMHPVPLVMDRWEAFIPISSDIDSLYFRYKFNYSKDTFGGPRPDSLTSPEYKLKIVAP